MFKTQTYLIETKKVLEKVRYESFEADMRPEYRLLLDYDILGSLKIEGEKSESDVLVDYFFEEPIISKGNWVPGFDDLKILAIDIETSMDSEKLYSVSIATNKGYGEVLIVGKKNLKRAVYCETENDLIKKLKEKII